MKKIIQVLCLLIISNLSYSKDFKYESVMGCGPTKPTFDKPRENDFDYFYIHKSRNGDFVIWNNNYQYPSFTELEYYQLWIQNGAKTSSKLTKINDTLKYELITKYTDEITPKLRTLMIDVTSMAFISKINGYKPTLGICWMEDLK